MYRTCNIQCDLLLKALLLGKNEANKELEDTGHLGVKQKGFGGRHV